MSIRQKKLPIQTLEQIDDRCAEFERRWQQDLSPTIESMITDDFTSDAQEVLLAELIALDLDYRQRRGERPDEANYRDRFPEHETAIRDAMHESAPSNRAFVPPSVDQLAELFPTLEITELLGAGGMGAVYKARQTGLDRVVALKILPEEFGHDVKFALRFTREARTLAKLNHPNIVSVYEFGHVNDTYYFLMEFVEGSTLRDIVAARQLEPAHALAIVPHLCDALQYAHDNGVIHRDIKPENILMAKDGSVKIADFGLSRILGDHQPSLDLTGTHQVMGTPRYMAPEQLEGARGVDHRTDIYSLGVVFYEMLTGELPIGRFAAPSQKVHVDVRLDEVVLRTLEKEPQRRYQRASQIKSDVQSIASGDRSAPAMTQVEHAANPTATNNNFHSETQAQSGQWLLTRRELMNGVKRSLRPLFFGQLFQIVTGIAFIALGAWCWAPNTRVPHLLISGVIVHLYGLFLLVCAINVLVRISQIDTTKPLPQVRQQLQRVRRFYLGTGPIIGFTWWLLWIPVAVAAGFDQILHPNSLYPSLLIGVIGLFGSLWIVSRAMKSEKGKQHMSGRSIQATQRALDEIEQANIA
ncbi:serine/threonine-protein kinase [Rhodopirellula halodulae]|uniref:serine/threonine-protein kinase n=1 Tax=Rhodopirellula halodulae TaxID=2894198 RepID=UPI001E55F0ED|nr:serine/threonine-protein kinase [Rhodopirellula sp. JC737]MCC9657325.1 bifunctional serine/threonine protein kinase/MFS transporter [Rhodopirellula sp. JC737]